MDTARPVGPVAPSLNMDVGFLVQLADGCQRYFAAPQCLSNVLHTQYRYADWVHLNQDLLHAVKVKEEFP